MGREEVQIEKVVDEVTLKRESLSNFSRIKEDDHQVVEEVNEVLLDDRIAFLRQAIIDDETEITRRQESKSKYEAELASYG